MTSIEIQEKKLGKIKEFRKWARRRAPEISLAIFVVVFLLSLVTELIPKDPMFS